MSEQIISHAFVLPDKDFEAWLEASKVYMATFERVAVVRSPAGNDLNRFRNVTAVEAPRVWYKDDAHAHIRRAYPMVVRVDVIRAKTPAELASIVQARVAVRDRYGEGQNNPVHLYDRFTLEWPTDARPYRVTGRFYDDPADEEDYEGIDIHAPGGAQVMAAAPGIVSKVALANDQHNYGPYVQVKTLFNNITYLVTYGNLRTVAARLGQPIEVGDKLGESAGPSIRLIGQNPPHGLRGFQIPNVIDPTPLIFLQGLKVSPMVNVLNIRSLPSTDGEIIGQVRPWDLLDSLEPHGRTLVKLGVTGQWLRVRMPDGKIGYTAAWYLKARAKDETFEAFPGVNPVGVNLDRVHPQGVPDTSRLGALGWVRFGYNVSAGRGSEDIYAAYDTYAPVLERYARAGRKVVLTFTHQTYGEGKQEFWPWQQMSDDQWRKLTARLADMMRRIAAQYAGKDLVHAWQVWNEQDAPIGASASVPMHAHNYAHMLTETMRAIRSSDSTVQIITGGHTGGPGLGAPYARQTMALMPSGFRPDGIAFHPYGRGAAQSPTKYRHFGLLEESIMAFSQILPDKPLWITEWGVLNAAQEPSDAIGGYALDFVKLVKSRFGGMIATMIWYAWAEGMHNGYGIVDGGGNPRHGLTAEFLGA